jgi:hypothetical protein
VVFRCGEDRQGRKGLLPPPGERLQQHREALQQPFRRRRIEQVGVVLQREAQPALPFDRMEHQVEGGRRPVQRERCQPEVRRPDLHPLLTEGEGRQPLGAARLLLHHEGDLEQGRPAGIAHRLEVLDEERQRILPMFEGGERRLLDALEELREGGISREVATQDYRIDEIAHRAGEP